MFGFLGQVAKVATSPVGRVVGQVVGSAVGKKVFKRTAVANAVKEGTEALVAIEFLKNKYGDVDKDAKWAWKELDDFKRALGELI